MVILLKKIWILHSFPAFCYEARVGSNGTSCNAKQGNPFGPFWDTYNIDFVKSEFYKPLHYHDVYYTQTKQQWNQYYPAETWPVLAFTGAPASFPVQPVNKPLQKCLNWNNDILNKAKAFIKKTLPRGAFVGIHLRNGIDWVCGIWYSYFYTENIISYREYWFPIYYIRFSGTRLWTYTICAGSFCCSSVSRLSKRTWQSNPLDVLTVIWCNNNSAEACYSQRQRYQICVCSVW